MQKFVDDLVVAELERTIVSIDDGDLDAELGEHRRVFNADDAAADDRKCLGQTSEVDDVVAGENGVVIGLDGRRGRDAARGDEDELGGGVAIERTALDRDGVRVDEASVAGKQVDVVAGELPRHHIEFACDHAIDAVHQFPHGRPRPIGGGAARKHMDMGKGEDGLAKGLARNRARVQADAAHHARAFDDADTLAEFCGLHCGALTGGSAAKDEEVVVVCHRVAQCRDQRSPCMAFDRLDS